MRSVNAVLRDPPTADRMTIARARRMAPSGAGDEECGEASAAHRVIIDGGSDCAEIDPDGYLPAVVALPRIIGASADMLFPALAGGRRSAGPSTLVEARAAFERRGGLRPCICGSGMPARSCCAN
jgi:hypothetical protein